MARDRDPFVSALRTLRDRTITGVFSPGKPIVILEEAQALGFSTTPVREALAWLGGEGLIARAPAGGYAGLSLDAAGLAGRYRLRLHCLNAGLQGAALSLHATDPGLFPDATRLFRHIVAGAADPVLIAAYDRVQATIERFASAEARLLGDMPRALEAVVRQLADGAVILAAEELQRFHERRIQAAPLLAEADQARTGAG